MLTIMPGGGLCNRLYALHSAIRLSADLGQPLRVFWRFGPEFGCRLEDVIEVPPEVAQIFSSDRLHRSTGKRLAENWMRLTQRPPILGALQPREVEAMIAAGFDFRSLGRQKHIAIRSWSLFYPGEGNFYPFRPVPHLAARVAALTEGFSATVGVHIRRTDHKPSIAHSPTELFLARMRQLVEEDLDTTFFVATDAADEMARLEAAFPGRIRRAAPRSLARAAREGIEGAVVDLYALAATQRVLGSFASTFSHAAGKLGGIPVEVMVANPPEVIVW
ncbi:hypothetical protein [Phaeovulum sp.]|uniref:hypothetical protein n=1 Tax=Phaeovulum sp. TaxID=2934796 RepID=UPI00272F768D|nr:hypothetical protein [Phaeovulum sp.]MDP1670130.1 hypothetical protein [Phaeovulum sp.]MDZ4120374.1 hypothetical protein [Phaeovulum sp.]